MVVEQTGPVALPVEAGIGHQLATAAEDVQEGLDLPFTVDKPGDRFTVVATNAKPVMSLVSELKWIDVMAEMPNDWAADYAVVPAAWR